MGYPSLENQLFLLQAIDKTNKDFAEQYANDESNENKSVYILDKTKQLFRDLEDIDSRLTQMRK